MFKKRTAKTNAVNLNNQISQIQFIPENLHQNAHKQNIVEGLQKIQDIHTKNETSTQKLQNINQLHKTPIFGNKMSIERKYKEYEQNNQNEEIFIKHLINQKYKQGSNQPLHQRKNQNVTSIILQQEKQKFEMLQFLQNLKKQKYKYTEDEDKEERELPKPTDIIQNILIIDDRQSQNQVIFNNNSLQVVQDFQQGISPVVSQDQQNFYNRQEDYEDILIRKTLTRQNYKRISQTNSLKHSKQKTKSQKLIKMINSISQNHLQSNINHQIVKKNQSLQQLKKQLAYLQQRTNQKDKNISLKRATTEQLKQQYKKLMKIIYFICYRGDSVEQFDMKVLSQLSEDLDIEQFKKGKKKIKQNQKYQNQIDQNRQDDDDDGMQVIMEEDQY